MYKPPSYYSSGANIHHLSLIPSTSYATSPPTHPHHRGGGTMTMGWGEGGTQNPEHIFDGVVSRLNSWCISFWYSLRDSYLHCLIWEPKSYWSMPMAGLRVLAQGNGKQSILTSLADLAVDVRCVGFWVSLRLFSAITWHRQYPIHGCFFPVKLAHHCRPKLIEPFYGQCLNLLFVSTP